MKPLDLETRSRLLDRLRRAWEQSPRASGGELALAGFDFQFLLFLLKLVERWVSLPEEERARTSIFTESVSDIVDLTSLETVVVTQVKLTQSSHNVRSALDELWEVYLLAWKETPELAPRLAFQIVSEQPELKDVERSIQGWKPVPPLEPQATQFRKAVRAEIVPEPRTGLLELLADRLKVPDPQRLIQRWLGMLLDAGDHRGLRRATEEVWSDLRRNANHWTTEALVQFLVHQRPESLADAPRTTRDLASKLEALRSGSTDPPPREIDLTTLETPLRFQSFCTRLVQTMLPNTMTIVSSKRDDSRDIRQVVSLDGAPEVLLQCEFASDLSDEVIAAVADPLSTLADIRPLRLSEGAEAQGFAPRRRWLLCLPVDPPQRFLDEVGRLAEAHDLDWEVWGATELKARLATRPDVRDGSFYLRNDSLRLSFRTETLQLATLRLDPGCQWRQWDESTLSVSRKGNVRSPDMIFDVILLNHSETDTFVSAIEAELSDVSIKAHGLPGEALLISQITYEVSIQNGTPGRYQADCEPPLVVRTKRFERFKIRIKDTGYGWFGTLRLKVRYGILDRWLSFPFIRIAT